MEPSAITYSTVLSALKRILGDENAGNILTILEKENLFHNGIIDPVKIELALRPIFADASPIILHEILLTAQKRSTQA